MLNFLMGRLSSTAILITFAPYWRLPGTIILRWQMRRRCMSELQRLLELDNKSLADIGLTRTEIRYQLHQIRRIPLMRW
jgi:uncharacterized protein YjiS (DUF1127 family)